MTGGSGSDGTNELDNFGRFATLNRYHNMSSFPLNHQTYRIHLLYIDIINTTEIITIHTGTLEKKRYGRSDTKLIVKF